MYKDSSNNVARTQIGRRQFIRDGLITAATGLLPSVDRLQSVQADEIAQDGEARIGSCPRPFYIIGHDTNSIDVATRCLISGANALEIDVNVLSGDRTKLCVCHGPELRTGPASNSSMPLSEFLTDLNCERQVIDRLSLLYFDCKSLAATEGHFRTMLDLINSKLTTASADNTRLSIIISVASLKDRAMFANAKTLLSSNQAVMIDGEKDFHGVVDLFSNQLGITAYCFANGISVANNLSQEFSPSIGHSLKTARTHKAASADPKLIFTWTVNNRHLMKRWVQFGVDGIISDLFPPWYNPGRGLTELVDLVENHGSELGIRIATRRDNPFGYDR